MQVHRVADPVAHNVSKEHDTPFVQLLTCGLVRGERPHARRLWPEQVDEGDAAIDGLVQGGVLL